MEDFYVEKLKERLRSLRGEVYTVSREVLASESSQRILDCVLLIIDAIEVSLPSPSDLEGLEEREKEIIIKRRSGLIVYIYQLLGIISSANRKDVPLELISPLTRYLKEFFEECHLLIRSVPALNYYFIPIREKLYEIYVSLEIEHKDNGVFCSETKIKENPKYGELPAEFVILSIPKVEKNNILYNAILGHEIGHGIFKDHESEFLELDFEEIRRFGEITVAENPEDFGVSSVGDLEEGIFEIMTGYLREWREEVICDIAGFLLFGPAFLFAFFDLFAPVFKSDEFSTSHPPDRGRYNLMWKLLNGEYYPGIKYRSKVFKEKGIKEFLGVLESVGMVELEFQNEEGEKYNKAGLLTWRLIERDIPSIVNTLTEIIRKRNIYGPSEFDADIKNYADYLANIIPIPEEMPLIEGSVPLSLPTILNVGWYVCLARLDGIVETQNALKHPDKQVTKAEVFDKLQEIILKSIELSDYKFLWELYRGQLEC